MKWPKIGISSSISTSLIQLVFIVYLSVTIIITCIQLANEYYHTKDLIRQELIQLEEVFEGGLSEALFNVDVIGLESIIQGIYKIPVVKGVMVVGEFGDQKQQIGYGETEDRNQFFVKKDGTVLTEGDPAFRPLRGIFSHKFTIDYTYIRNEKVGKLTIYSGANVILERISYGFILIIINSLILIGVLWAIIYHFTSKVIGKPLKALTQTTEKLNPSNLDFKTISYSEEERALLDANNELGMLSRSFDKMRMGILERINNLQEIKNLGEDFSGSYDVAFSFKRIMQILDNKFSFHRGQLYIESPEQVLTSSSYDAPPVDNLEDLTKKITQQLIHLGKKNQIRCFSMQDIFPNLVKGKSHNTFLYIPLVDEDRYMGALAFFENNYPFSLTDENTVFLQALARLTVINFKKINMLEVVKENTRLSEEMKLARHIQTILLPREPKLLGFEVSVSLDPVEEVGGDYYDIITIGDYKWLVIGDVSGHGISAGLIMMMVQTSIHTVLINNPSVDPSHLLSIINEIIFQNIERMEESKHMTITVLAVEKDGNFAFSGLHEDILIHRDATGEVEEVETSGMWIGLEPDISDILTTDHLRLSSGDCMVLYTDGITEAIGRDNELYGSKKMIEIIKENGTKSAHEIHQAIITSLNNWEKDDDVTLLVIKKIT